MGVGRQRQVELASYHNDENNETTRVIRQGGHHYLITQVAGGRADRQEIAPERLNETLERVRGMAQQQVNPENMVERRPRGG